MTQIDAAIYARFSSDNQREESIDAQIRAIKEFVARENYRIVRVYTDEARSATTDQRPGFLQMMRDAMTGAFEVVIVHKLDRFSRDRYDSAYYKRHLRKHNVQLISVLENLDDSPESVILESVLEGLAEYYSKNLAREVMKGMRETAYQCKHTGGIPPLGYDVAPDRTYVINEAEAEAVRLIFTMYDQGCGYADIIDTLNERGFRTKRGGRFGKNSIYGILRNEKYSGAYVFNRTASAVNGTRNHHRNKDPEEIIRIPGGIPAIVSPELFERVQARMNKNRRAQASYRAKETYVLSGHIYCGNCGHAMSGTRQRKNQYAYYYYVCTGRKNKRNCTQAAIPRDEAEELVINTLYEQLLAPGAVEIAAERIWEYANASRSKVPSQIRMLRKQIAAVDLQIDNIVDAIANGMFHASMKEKLSELEGQKSALHLQLLDAEQKEASGSFTKEQIAKFLRTFENIKEMSKEEQKRAVDLFIDRVTVYDDRIEVDVATRFGHSRARESKSASDGERTPSTGTEKPSNEDKVSDTVGGGEPHNDVSEIIYKTTICIPRD